ncbi:MAG: metal ABC transporter ATP-binding protein [Micropepsaceae bacterium]
MAGPAISFSDVNLTLGGLHILRDVSFKIESGELVAIIGPNGGGKTCLIRSLLGQMPHSGTVRSESDSAVQLGYVPQFLEIDRTLPLTVTNIMSIMVQRTPAFFGVKRKYAAQIDAALDRAGFKGKRNRLFGGLSGGERQRVLFAQALMPEPNLLVLDEPTANMDEAGAHRVEEVVLELNALGTTVLWINHDLAQVKRIAGKVVVVDGGVPYCGPLSEMPPQIAQTRARVMV